MTTLISPHSTPVLLLTTLVASVACSAEKGGGEQTVSCISALGVAGLSSQTLLECTSVDIAASFEFDPDKRPAARTIDLTVHGAEGGGVDCGLTLSLRGLCGAGTYEVGPEPTTRP